MLQICKIDRLFIYIMYFVIFWLNCIPRRGSFLRDFNIWDFLRSKSRRDITTSGIMGLLGSATLLKKIKR